MVKQVDESTDLMTCYDLRTIQVYLWITPRQLQAATQAQYCILLAAQDAVLLTVRSEMDVIGNNPLGHRVRVLVSAVIPVVSLFTTDALVLLDLGFKPA